MVKDILTSNHPGAQIPGATIASLFAEWLQVRDRTDELAKAGDDEAMHVSHARYLELQKIITDHMAPVTAQDLAMQIATETDGMESVWRDEFEARIFAFAKRPAVHPSEDEREAKFEAALSAFRDAAKEYDPAILSIGVYRSDEQGGRFRQVDMITFNRSRAFEDEISRARGEIA